MVHAIALTLVRVVITQRRLLEWETAAAQAARAAGLLRQGIRSFFVEMAASPIAVLGLLGLISTARPGALPLALPFLALWRRPPPARTGSADQPCRAGGRCRRRTAIS